MARSSPTSEALEQERPTGLYDAICKATKNKEMEALAVEEEVEVGYGHRNLKGKWQADVTKQMAGVSWVVGYHSHMHQCVFVTNFVSRLEKSSFRRVYLM